MNEERLYKELGRAIAGRRTRLELTQATLAKTAGISRASLANMEVGRQKVLVHQLYRLAAALKLDGPAKLLPLGTLDGVQTSNNLPISEDLSARQRAQVEEVYRLAGGLKSDDGKSQ